MKKKILVIGFLMGLTGLNAQATQDSFTISVRTDEPCQYEEPLERIQKLAQKKCAEVDSRAVLVSGPSYMPKGVFCPHIVSSIYRCDMQRAD